MNNIDDKNSLKRLNLIRLFKLQKCYIKTLEYYISINDKNQINYYLQYIYAINDSINKRLNNEKKCKFI